MMLLTKCIEPVAISYMLIANYIATQLSSIAVTYVAILLTVHDSVASL